MPSNSKDMLLAGLKPSGLQDQPVPAAEQSIPLTASFPKAISANKSHQWEKWPQRPDFVVRIWLLTPARSLTCDSRARAHAALSLAVTNPAFLVRRGVWVVLGRSLIIPLCPSSLSPWEPAWSLPAHGTSRHKPRKSLPPLSLLRGSALPVPAVALAMLSLWTGPLSVHQQKGLRALPSWGWGGVCHLAALRQLNNK